MKKLIVASNNANKIKEIKEMLLDLDIEVLSLIDSGINIDVEETADTFKDNAYLKAKEIFDLVHIPVLSDDSGLEVMSLNNDPGIYSARYAGPQKCDEDNINLLLQNIKDHENRKARFVCAMVLIISDSEEYVTEGYLNGEIIDDKRGIYGFGYDPIFYLPQYKKTLAQLDSDEKNKISHRANALHDIVKYLKER